MAEKNDFPKVILKKKNIPVIVDFCLEESIEFTVRQQTFPDTDWEVELRISDIKVAILVGMFLRDNKMELHGLDSQKLKKPAPAKKSKEEDKASDIEAEEPKSDYVEAPGLNF